MAPTIVVEDELARGVRDLIYWNRVRNQLKTHVKGETI